MVRTKRQQQEDNAATTLRSSSRKRAREGVDDIEGTPPKRRGGTRPSNPHSEYDFPSDDDTQAKPIEQGTPKRKGRPPATTTINGNGVASTPRGRKSKGTNPVTPSTTRIRGITNGETPRRQRNDRSARKKSARALIEKVVGGVSSDEEADEDIAREIYESSEDGDIGEDNVEAHPGEGDTEELHDETATPSKSLAVVRKRRRGQEHARDPRRRLETCPPMSSTSHRTDLVQRRHRITLSLLLNYLPTKNISPFYESIKMLMRMTSSSSTLSTFSPSRNGLLSFHKGSASVCTDTVRSAHYYTNSRNIYTTTRYQTIVAIVL